MAFVLPDEAVGPLVLTLDIGTSSIRALVYDAQARLLHPDRVQGKEVVVLQTGRNGEGTFPPNRLLLAAGNVIDQALESLGSLSSKIRAVACDSFASSMLVLDGRGQPITEIFTYADNQCQAEADLLREKFNQTQDHDRTGCMTHCSYWPARLAWLSGNQGDLWKKARTICSWTDWLLSQWFGTIRTSLSLASWTGLLDRRSLGWDQVGLDRASLEPNRMAPLGDFSDALCGLSAKWARRWPSLADIPWFLPISDGAAANVGSGAHKPGRVALTIGTTAAIRTVPKRVPSTLPKGLWNYRIDKNRPLIGGATTEGGNIFAWMRQNIQEFSHLEERLSEREVGIHGLTILPFWAGERAPNWNDKAKGLISGITLDTSPLDLMQASLEAVSCRLALIFGSMGSFLGKAEIEIVAGGGFLSSPFWVSRMADALGHSIKPCRISETTSRGMALLALEALGVFSSTKPFPDPDFDSTVDPDPNRSAAFAVMMAEQQDLYKRVYGIR